MKTALVILAALLCFSVYAASDMKSGVWTAELNTDGTALQMTLFRGHDSEGRNNSMMGFRLKLASLTGLNAADVRAASANVQFTLTRPAGSIAFEGRFSNGTGAGSFRFTRNEGFERELAAIGYSSFNDNEMLAMMESDFTPQVVRDMRALGYQPTKQQVVEMAIFNVNADMVREFARLGYPNLSFQSLVNLRVGHVDAAYITAMKELGYDNISASKLANLAILGVTPAYVRELRSAGLGELSSQSIENLRIGRITKESIEGYKRLGLNPTPRELGDFGIHKVTPEYIEQLRALGYTNLTPQQLIEMRIFRVTPEFIRDLAAHGYTGVPVEKLVKLRMTGADEIFTGKKSDREKDKEKDRERERDRRDRDRD